MRPPLMVLTTGALQHTTSSLTTGALQHTASSRSTCPLGRCGETTELPSAFLRLTLPHPPPAHTSPPPSLRCRPSQIVLVHGEANMMASLKKQLVSKYDPTGDVKGIWSPQNTEAVSLTFHESKVAKVIGSVAVERPREGASLQGVVLHKNFQLTIVSVDEMAQHAGLQVAAVVQRQQVPFNQPWEVLLFHLSKLFDDVQVLLEAKGGEETTLPGGFARKAPRVGGLTPGGETPVRVLDAVNVRKAAEGVVSLEWESNPVNDLVADSVVCVIMQTLSSPTVAANMVKVCLGTPPPPWCLACNRRSTA